MICVTFLAGTILLVADEPKAQRDRSTEAAVTIEPDQLLFTPGGVGEILITDVKSTNEFRMPTPEAKERITEVRACRWVKHGFAVAVETIPVNPKTPAQRSYYWITGWLGKRDVRLSLPDGKAAPRHPEYWTGERFLTSDENYDLGMIANPQGDSIYILLTRFRRTADGDEISGYSFSNNCPVAAPHAGGLLQRIASDPKTMQWVNIHPDDEPSKP
jgi:hypothetical protein